MQSGTEKYFIGAIALTATAADIKGWIFPPSPIQCNEDLPATYDDVDLCGPSVLHLRAVPRPLPHPRRLPAPPQLGPGTQVPHVQGLREHQRRILAGEV